MSTVFISYRRETAAGEARALSTNLVALLGKNSVFMDVDNIALGRDFRSELQTVLQSCKVMLVIIDKDWLGVKDERGRTRLENPDDVVRLEVEAGLKRDIAVTPVLVKGARMPTATQLPPEISKLADRNGFELSHTRWKSDVRAMTERLGLVAPEEAKAGRSQSNLRRVTMVSVLLLPIVISGLIVGYFVKGIQPGACDGIFEQSVPELSVKMRFIEANGEWAIGKEKIQDIDKDAQKVGMHLKACCISQEKGFMKPEQFQVCMAGAKEYEAKIVRVASNIDEAQAAKQQGDTQLAEKKATEAKIVAGESTNVVAKVAQAAEKTSPPPARDANPHFFDDFKGKTLAGHWEVIRPNNDNYAVEKDGILIINSKAGSLGEDNIPNLFRLETAMPDGNWTATVKFSSEFPLGNESFLLGLFQDKDHWTAATLNARTSNYYNYRLDIDLSKKSADEIVSSNGPLILRECNPCNEWSKFISDNNLNQPIYLRLQRTGHDFVVSSRLEKSEPDTWVTIKKIASLSALGNLVIGFVQTSQGTGQTQATIEWLKIESP